MENKVDLDNLLFQKLQNFKSFIINNLLKYVDGNNIELAELNVGMLDMPFFVVKLGMRSIFIKDRYNLEIIQEIAADYFVDLSQVSKEDMDILNLYCDFFKKYLNI